MSDPINTLASQAQQPAAWDGGGLFQGPDGRLSLRRIATAVLIVWGAVLETIGQTQTGDLVARIAPGGVLLVAALIIIGALSVQSIMAGIRAAKGQ
jgi:hypothetical protein